MLIKKITEKVHVKLKKRQLIFGSILIGLFLFLLPLGISFGIKMDTISACRVDSGLHVVVCEVV